MSLDLDEALAKIRPHTSSSLAHQKAPATLLRALESTFEEQRTERSPTAYFAALLTTLEATLQSERSTGLSLGEGDVLPAELYLLALVSPFVPPPIIRGNINTVLSLSAPLFPHLNAHAPPLRSQLTLYDAVFRALDRSQLENPTVHQCFATVLQLCTDPRPKVRKKAAELVSDVLAGPPVPLTVHPYAEKVVDWAIGCLEKTTGAPIAKSKGKQLEDVGQVAIHVLACIRPCLSSLPKQSLPPLINSMLHLPRLGNSYLSETMYNVISDLVSPDAGDEDGVDIAGDIVPELLNSILSSAPLKSDTAVAISWAAVVGSTTYAYSRRDVEGCTREVGRAWKAVWAYLDTRETTLRQAAASALDMVAQSITPSLISPAIAEAKTNAAKSTLNKIISELKKAVDSLVFASAIPELLSVLTSLILNLKVRNGGSRDAPTAAEQLLLPLVQKIGDLRLKKGFEHKEAVDSMLSAAMRVIGPHVIFTVLPLNLEPEDRKAGKDARAFLLPLLASPHPSPLGHFVSYFVPLTERMFDLQSDAEANGRQSEAKVWSVLVAQIWSGLPGYCWGAPDLKEALNQSFSALLSQLLYNQAELRPAVLKALKLTADSQLALSRRSTAEQSTLKVPATMQPISQEQAHENVAFLRTQADSWLSVLFNVFGTLDQDARGPVGEVISSWAALAGVAEMQKVFQKVVGLYKQNLKASFSPKAVEALKVTTTAQDLLFILLPYITEDDSQKLLELILGDGVLSHRDNGVQKRSYKIIARLLEGGRVRFDAEDVLKRLDLVSDNTQAAAKKDRLTLLAAVVQDLPENSMHMIPTLIPEAVLGTKEPSERARTTAFNLVVTMGYKMSAGGVVRRDKVNGMDEDGPVEVEASIEEYLTMVAAGLAGASPHMISATITAMSRLVFEFKDLISPTMQSEIFTTLLVFLSSANREIVKSTLGFIKLAIHTLPANVMSPHLKDLVSALLRWAGDHNNHFKPKVRHIFERMIRRFGWEDVYQCVGDAEAGKVLVNIKKRKDRAKRKRARAAEEMEVDEKAPGKMASGNAFEDVLYGSESELGDSEAEEEPGAHAKAKGKQPGKDSGPRIRIDDDDPMDLLEGAASRITTGEQHRRKKPGKDAARFKTDAQSGKLLIQDEDGDAAMGEGTAGEDVVGTAYRESLTSADGFTRGPNGRVKFNKDTKKRRRETADAGEDVAMADADAAVENRKTKKRSPVKLGQEFKAKKAGGDMKKGGVDPYAYLPLSQAAKRKNKSGRSMTITGKR